MKQQCPPFFSKLYLLAVFLLFSFMALAQVEQTARYEREHKNNDSEFILVPMGERGILLIHDKDQYRDGKKLWELIGLNSDLKESWNLEMDIETRLRLVGYD